MEDSRSNDAAAAPQAPTGAPGANEKQWAVFAHLSALLGGMLTSGAGIFLGPLIIWLVKKDTMPFVADQAKEALNFAITVLLAFAALVILTVITFGVGAVLSVPLGLVIAIAALVLIIIAAIKANEGIAYRYPIALRLVK
jgi:uncharacterized Tic20 family protein